MRMLLHALLASLPAWGYAQCPVLGERLEYGEIRVPGRLIRQTFPGPPDYEDVTRGDAAQIIWVLLLDQPTCVSGDPHAPPARGVREIELVQDPDPSLDWRSADWRDLLGKRVIVSGRLARGGATHQKRVVLITREIQRARLGPGKKPSLAIPLRKAS